MSDFRQCRDLVDGMMGTCRRSTPTSATSPCRAATSASTAGSSPPCARPGSTADRAARRSHRSVRNVDFYPTAAAAQQRGFRACKRCRPDASPGSPEWNVRQDVVARAMRLIADGVVEREGVPGLARRLGYSERHLNRLFTDELGAGPLAVARAQRAHTARLLIETTSLPLTDVAFAAGFGSVRQFNDTIREVFAASPSRPPSSEPRSSDAPPIVGRRSGSGRRDRRGRRPPRRSAAVRRRRGDGVHRRAGDPRARVVGRRRRTAVRSTCRAGSASSTSSPPRPCRGSARADGVVGPRRRRRSESVDCSTSTAIPAAVDAALGSDPRNRGSSSRPCRDAEHRPVSIRTRRRSERSSASRCRSLVPARWRAGSSQRVGRPLPRAGRRRSHTCFPGPRNLRRLPMKRSRCRAPAATRSAGSPAPLPRVTLELDVGSDPAVAHRSCSSCRGSVRGPPTTS